MEASEYYESLIQQGYSPQQAEQYTSQHYPGFTAQPKASIPIQDSVVGGNIHSGDVIHHHHAAPVVQAEPAQEQSLWAPAQSAAQPVFLTETKKKIYIAPWVGVGLIVFMLIMPFVQVSFEGENIGESMSGFEIIGEMGEAASESDGGGDGGGDDFDMGDIPEEWVLFGIAILMLMFSPVVYLLFAIISTGLLAFKKHTLVVGILHLLFFAVFFACSVLGTIEFEGFTMSAHANMAGWGFFGAGLAGILLCIKA